MSDRTDDELLAAWAAGDSGAASELFGRHVGALVRFFDRKIDGPVDDLVQETMVRCLAARDRIRPELGFRGYLFGIARHVLYHQLSARHRRTGELDPEASCLQDLEPTPSEHLAYRHDQRLLLDALRRLPLDTQVLLELYHWQGVSGPELAEIYGLGEKAVRSRLHRAKESLRAAMAQLAASPEQLASSIADFEAWARALPKSADEDT